MTRPRGEPQAPDDGLASFDKPKALLGLLLALALAGGAITGIGQIAHFGQLQQALHEVRGGWLAISLGGQLLSYMGYILAYRDAARASGGPRFRFPTAARVVVFGAGAQVLGASVGGLAVDFWAMRRTGSKRHTTARRVLALGTIEWSVLSLYACTSAVLVLITGAHAPLVMALGWLVAVPACVLAALWFTAPARARRFSALPDPPARADAGRFARALAWLAQRARAGLADALGGVILVRHLLSHPLRYSGGALGYPIYWAGDILTLYAGVRAFGVHVNAIALVLAYSTSYVISALPLPAGGAGGIEAGMATALHAVGIPLAPALLGVLVYRIVTFWLPVIPALILLPSLRQLHRALPSTPHTQKDTDERPSFRPRAEGAA